MRAIFPAFLFIVGWIQPVRADEPHTFWGETVEGWIAVLRDKASNEAQRRQAVWALGCFGVEAAAAVPDLIEAVRKGPCRDEAVDALVSIGAAPEVTLPILIDRFVKWGPKYLTGQGMFFYDAPTHRALARVGAPAAPPLLKILNGPDGEMRVSAAYALGEIGPAARAAVPALIRAIERPDPKVEPDILVHHAIRALGRIGPDARAAIPALGGLLERKIDYTFDYYFDVVIALDGIGALPVRKLLDTFLRDADPYQAWQLAWLGPKAREVVPSLRAALTDRRLQVRFSAAVALARIEPSVEEGIPVLIEALDHLKDEELDVIEVPKALARFGPRGREALPALIRLVQKGAGDEDLFEALVQIDPEGTVCVPVLIEALTRRDESIVAAAVACLGLLGPRAKKAVPALAAVLSRDFGERDEAGADPQRSAAESLRRIGPGARSVIPALIGALRCRRIVRDGGFDNAVAWRDCATAAAAAGALGALGPEARAAIPALIESIRSPDEEDTRSSYSALRRAATLALGRIGRDARAAIPLLRDLVEEDDRKSGCQLEAVIALNQLAPDGKDTVERWLKKPESRRAYRGLNRGYGLEGRAMVLGAMGRTSFETEWMVRGYLELLNDWLMRADPRDLDPVARSEDLVQSDRQLRCRRAAGHPATVRPPQEPPRPLGSHVGFRGPKGYRPG